VRSKSSKINLKALKKAYPSSADHLDLFESIQRIVNSVKFKPASPKHPEELREALGSGKTVLDTCLPALDAGAFASAIKRLFGFLERRNPEEYSNTSRIQLPDRFISDYLHAEKRRIEECANELGISTAALVSCCQQAARPQLVALREANAGTDLSRWSGSHCPFCGALPAMAEIDSKGLRFLLCPNCLAAYRFGRHYCPGCGHPGLNVLQMEAWPGLILESCPNCKAYLKTWSHGAGPPPCPFPYLDIVTRDVDEAAQLQDLKRLSLSVMGV
jgi:formate dehydrogenase maturation protein FdhE